MKKNSMMVERIQLKWNWWLETYRTHSLIIDYAGVILYKLLLDIGYKMFLNPVYEYAGFESSFSMIKCFGAWIVLLLFLPSMHHMYQSKKASDIMMLVTSFMYFVPMLTYCTFNDVELKFMISVVIYWAILSFLQCLVPDIVFKEYRGDSRKIYGWLILIVILFVVLISYHYTGLRIYTGNRGIYEIRAEAAAYGMPTIISYLWSIVPAVIAILAVYTLKQKKYLACIGLIVAEYIVFSFGCHKSVFFLLILSVLGYVVWGKNRINLLSWGMSALCVLTLIEYKMTGISRIGDILLRRNLFIQNQVSFRAFEFFSSNPIDIYRQGPLRILGQGSVYNEVVARILGERYYHQTNNANAGLLGDMYENMGLIGLIVLPIVIFMCFRLFDMVTCNINMRYLIGICIFFAVCFREGSFSTVLLTHGYLIACVLLYFFPRDNEESKSGFMKKEDE